MSGLVLSLFPGIGLLDRGFEDEGFCVVRGPDLLWGGDVKKFHPPAGRFDGVIGGPPCQAHSQLRHLCVSQGFELAEDLIPEYERCVREAAPGWFLMENVPPAPVPRVEGYAVHSILLDNRQVGGVQKRTRRFSFGVAGLAPLYLQPRLVAMEAFEYAPAVLASSGGRRTPVAVGGSGKVKKTWTGGEIAKRRSLGGFRDSCRLQGLPDDFDLPPFTSEAKQRVVGNGVPYPMARAVAIAVREAVAGLAIEERRRSLEDCPESHGARRTGGVA